MRSDVPPAGARRVPHAAPSREVVEGEQWLIELPFGRPLSLNDRMHWQERNRATQEWVNAVRTLARHARIPALGRARIELFYTPRDDRKRDALNLVATLKACEDGLVREGVIVDDSIQHHESVMPVITAKGPARARGNRLWLLVTGIV